MAQRAFFRLMLLLLLLGSVSNLAANYLPPSTTYMPIVMGNHEITANTYVPSYSALFQFGLNPGYYGNGWDDQKIYAIGADAGAHSARASLPDSFIGQWGAAIRVPVFEYISTTLSFRENTVFLGEPRAAWRDTASYYSNNGTPVQSKLWQGMYEPIWDNGENGTPVNDANKFAVYVWQIASTYGKYMRFYEIINEPDYTNSARAYANPGASGGSWWDSAPTPNELPNLNAPIYNYIRLLRIAYTVIKKTDPDSYVAPGGIGYASFLDALLRYTDNPDAGKVSSQYPLAGGAYFDALSYHIYPQYGGSYWDNGVGGFVYVRHSDRMSQVFVNQYQTMNETLADRNYNGTTFPRKPSIITETNVSRKAFNNYAGGEEIQRNYLIKAIVKGQQLGILQIYWFATGEGADYATAQDEYQLMGFYENLKRDAPNNQIMTSEGVANRTTYNQLYGWRYDATATAALNLPSTIDGAAFRKNNQLRYVLWAKTTLDRNETASATINLTGTYTKVAWNGTSSTVSGSNIQLTGSPIFLTQQ